MEKINELQRQLNAGIEEEKAKLKSEREALAKEKEDWEKSKKKLETAQSGSRIKLDIGGQIFATAESTLTNKKSKFFTAMFSGRWNIKKEEDGTCFIDRDPSVFQHILNFLRGEELESELTKKEKKKILKDAEFYQIDELVELLALPQTEPPTFDSNKKAEKIVLSNGNCTARNSNTGHASVLSVQGSHFWKVRTDNFARNSHWIAIGVANLGVTYGSDYGQSYSISSQNDTFGENSSVTTPFSGDWVNGDIITVALDCDEYTLSVINERTKKGQSWQLPRNNIKEYFLYVNMYNSGDKVTILH